MARPTCLGNSTRSKAVVKAVNTLRVEGQTKLWKGRPGKRNDFKKAVVTLVEGSTIDVTTGI